MWSWRQGRDILLYRRVSHGFPCCLDAVWGFGLLNTIFDLNYSNPISVIANSESEFSFSKLIRNNSNLHFSINIYVLLTNLGFLSELFRRNPGWLRKPLWNLSGP
ncbi:hypothetical protein CDAR_30081 [Caerostris darwini]|uniref:Uncharacterized protein n=1 Tax=Caerostris darwini TaxID=1538125 RepID=A0AAV4TFZ0_9ARAC|nr:hypothetical protein CDAR_30081 [Caerostris darwini]